MCGLDSSSFIEALISTTTNHHYLKNMFKKNKISYTRGVCRRILYGNILLLPWLLVLSSCITESNSPDCPKGAKIILALDVSIASPVSSRSVDTRADDTYFELPEEECEALSKLRVVMVEDGKVTSNRVTSVSGNNIDSERFKYEVEPGPKRIYLFGNEDSYPEEYWTRLKSLLEGEEFDPTGWTLSATPRQPLFDWRENPDDRHLPMSEFFDVVVKPVETEADKTQTARLFVTRAATKFSFRIHKADDYQGVGTEKLTSIKIQSIGSREYLLPFNTTYSPAKDMPSTNQYEGRYVTAYDVPDTDNPKTDFVYYLPSPIDVSTLLAPYVYSPRIYLPETAGNEFLCTISFDGKEYVAPVRLNNLKALPRNTHVLVDITVGNGHSMILRVVALPWDTENFSFDFSENVGLATDGALSFVPGTYYHLDKTKGRIILNEYPNATRGSFGIASPLGAYWTAYLVTVSGQQGSILFQVNDGANTYTTDHISGMVGNQKANFSIVASGQAGTDANVAIMQVMVTMSSGNSLSANVLRGGGYGSDVEYITIVQNPQ